VLGAFIGNIATFGYINSWGEFQAYYQQNLLSDQSPSTIAWIGSIQYALVFLPGLAMGRLFDKGVLHIPLVIASILLAVSTLLVAECTKYWHFLLCQGFAIGLFSGIVFSPLPGVVTHWFMRKRGLAIGIMTAGASVGGSIFPVAIRNLINDVGFKWTMRILALIILILLVITNLTVVRRLPPKRKLGRIVDLQEFKEVIYSVYCVAGFVAFLGLYTVQTYINVSAAFVGVDASFSFYLVSISNAGSVLGRLAAGPMVDHWGAFNTMIPFTFIAGAMTYEWPFLTSIGSYIALGLIYGAASGVFAAMLTAPVFVVGDTETIGVRIGMLFSIIALGALAGPPISGAINDATGNYRASGYYAGSTIMFAVILLVICRQLRLGWKLRGRA